MPKTIKTNIIPAEQYFVKVAGASVLDKKAICTFIATGFFLDNDTYWEDVKTLRPGTVNTIDDNGYLIDSEPWFNWHYTPRTISFETAVEEFTEIFDRINQRDLKDRDIILPISGGLDSRSQVVSLLPFKNSIQSYSYSFTNGYKESKIARKIAKKAKFNFKEFLIPKGYLWQKIDEAAQINKCYAEFTHCRQLGVLDEYPAMGDVFSLGHWGDVLFDKVTDKNLSHAGQVGYLIKSVVKPEGVRLADELWEYWNLEGNFESYLETRISNLLSAISITDINAKLRAFKSLYWAPRWTSVNLAFFSKQHVVSLPYYENEICEFICTLPEAYLADRKIQIAYIKNKSTEIAKVTWQDKRPFNLYNYKWCKAPYNLPYRLLNKFKRMLNDIVGKKYIQRNWELQFLGEKNNSELNNYLSGSNISDIIDKEVVENTMQRFLNGNQKHTSHALSMLLTLAVFSNHFLYNKEKHIKNN